MRFLLYHHRHTNFASLLFFLLHYSNNLAYFDKEKYENKRITIRCRIKIIKIYIVPGVASLWSPEAGIYLPHVETYWESWDEGKGDFASNLKDVPITPIGKDCTNLIFKL